MEMSIKRDKERNGYSTVFQPGNIGNLRIKNRLIRSATFENLATRSGEITDELLNLYRVLAQGGVGLIITGHIGIHPDFRAANTMISAYDDQFINGLKRLAEVRSRGERINLRRRFSFLIGGNKCLKHE